MQVVAGLLGWTRDLAPSRVEEAVDQIAADGFAGVSFFYHYPLDEWPAAWLARLRTLADDLGLIYVVHGPFHDVNIGSQYENVRRASVADIAAALDFAA